MQQNGENLLPHPTTDTLSSLGIIFMSLDFLAASVPIYGETMVFPLLATKIESYVCHLDSDECHRPLD